jgi:hypothetical protein
LNAAAASRVETAVAHGEPPPAIAPIKSVEPTYTRARTTVSTAPVNARLITRSTSYSR